MEQSHDRGETEEEEEGKGGKGGRSAATSRNDAVERSVGEGQWRERKRSIEKARERERDKEGETDGVNCRRQGHRLYLAKTADTCLRRYTRVVL